MLLPGEDEEALEELGDGLRAQLQPVGELENLLVDRITSLLWRLRRLGKVEAGIFAWERSEERAERAEREASEHVFNPYAIMAAPYVRITDKEKHEEALSRAREQRREQETETAMLGRTFTRDADKVNAFSKLSRYETTLERGLYKALHELERRQAARQGTSSVPPPAVLDVDVSGIPEGDR